MTLQRRILFLSLWLLAFILAAWTLRQLPFDEMLTRLGQLTWQDYLLWLSINAAILYLAVKRWQILAMAVDTHLPMGMLFRMRQAGGAVSFLTPGPQFGGEPLQLYWLHRHSNIPLFRAAPVLGLDRFLETGTNIAVLLAGVFMMVGTTILPVEEWLQVAAILAAVLFVLLGAAMLIISHPAWLAGRFRDIAGRWQSEKETGSPPEGWDKLVRLLRNSLSQQRPRLMLALGLAIAGWGGLLLELLMLLRFLGLAPTVTELVLIMLSMRLAMLLPAPGGIGTVEASLFWSFGFLGLPLSAAAGLIALSRLRDGIILCIGLGCLAGFHGPATLSRPTVPAGGGIEVQAD